ncbi:unnamed protein product [Closterium sp. NIES-64]|nr:unnamed protein product [Closterium sp. NIES-64]
MGAAMADVVIDAMVVEAAKGEKEQYAGDRQSFSWLSMATRGVVGRSLLSLSWFSMAAGGVVGSLLGGPALKTLQPHGIESEESGELREWEQVVPEQVVPEYQEEEESVEGKGKERGSDILGPSGGDSNDKYQEAIVARKKDGEQERGGGEEGGKKEEGGGEKSAAREQSIGPMAWFMISCTVVPTITSSRFYFHTNRLHLDISFLGSTKTPTTPLLDPPKVIG